jgi:hypothetical protein
MRFSLFNLSIGVENDRIFLTGIVTIVLVAFIVYTLSGTA